MDVLMAFGEIGGLNEIILMFLSTIIGGFSVINSQALITNTLFKTKKQTIIPVPEHLEAKFAWNSVFCCYKLPELATYNKKLEYVETYMDKQLDLIHFIRRLRMHGIALTSLLDRSERNYISALQEKIEIEDDPISKEKPAWNDIEKLSYRERIAVGVFSRHHKNRP